MSSACTRVSGATRARTFIWLVLRKVAISRSITALRLTGSSLTSVGRA
jgi:hypothetical protein